MNAAALQRLTQNRLLDLKLRCVVCVLILAAAARAKMPARRRNSLRGGSHDLHGFRGRIATLFVHDANARLFARQRERNKNRLALNAREKVAAIERFFDSHEL
jgi:hypothetical protein